MCRCGIPVRNCLDINAREARTLRARVAELERLLKSAQDQTEEAQGIARESMWRFDEMSALLQGYKAGAARAAELTSALKATLCLSDACRCYGCGVARKVLASEVTP